MRKLVISVLVLLALFSALRAYTQAAVGGTAGGQPGAIGVGLHPGLVEISDGQTSIGVAFGAMEKTGTEPATAAEAVDYRDINEYDACIQRALIGMFWPEVDAGREISMEVVMKAAEAVDHRCDSAWELALQAHPSLLSKTGQRTKERKGAVVYIATILRLQWDASWKAD